MNLLTGCCLFCVFAVVNVFLQGNPNRESTHQIEPPPVVPVFFSWSHHREVFIFFKWDLKVWLTQTWISFYPQSYVNTKKTHHKICIWAQWSLVQCARSEISDGSRSPVCLPGTGAVWFIWSIISIVTKAVVWIPHSSVVLVIQISCYFCV